MGLGGTAAYLAEVNNRDELVEALDFASARSLPVIMIGGGSNIIWQDEGYAGLVLVCKIPGYETGDNGDGTVTLKVGSGENWDSTVARSVSAGLTGIEALSLIPGTAGATPIQNVGAYGQEIADTLLEVEAFDKQAGNFVKLQSADCGFGYRTSRFKIADRGRFFITSITLQLKKGNPAPPFYGSVQKYFEERGITEYTPALLREAVIAIRTAKLPDPAVVHNTGSFFANPIIDQARLNDLTARFGDLPNWPLQNGKFKLSAAWLIEKAGFKDYHDTETGMATWPKQPLVLVNEHARSTADLLKFKQKVISAVEAKFDVTLVQEPEFCRRP